MKWLVAVVVILVACTSVGPVKKAQPLCGDGIIEPGEECDGSLCQENAICTSCRCVSQAVATECNALRTGADEKCCSTGSDCESLLCDFTTPCGQNKACGVCVPVQESARGECPELRFSGSMEPIDARSARF